MSSKANPEILALPVDLFRGSTLSHTNREDVYSFTINAPTNVSIGAERGFFLNSPSGQKSTAIEIGRDKNGDGSFDTGTEVFNDLSKTIPNTVGGDDPYYFSSLLDPGTYFVRLGANLIDGYNLAPFNLDYVVSIVAGDNGGDTPSPASSIVINPESIPKNETFAISSNDFAQGEQPVFEISGGVTNTSSLSIDFQNVDESPTPINTNQSTEGGGTIASNAPQNLTLSLDGVYFNSGAGDDSIIGTAFNDFLRAGAGDDLIDAGGGNDLVRAGAGNDRITLGSGNDTLYLTADQLDGSTDELTDFNSAEDSIAFAENLTVSLVGNIATFTTEIDGVERSTQLIFSGFDTLSEEWFTFS